MAEKKFGLGTALLIGAVAAGIAGGVASYIKRAEIKKLAEDIISRVKPMDGADDEIGDWDIRSGMAEAEAPADAADVNIVDSGISLESVESPAEDAAEEPAGEDEPADGAQPESVAADEAVPEDAPESTEDAGEQPEAEAEQAKKKTWFWSK